MTNIDGIKIKNLDDYLRQVPLKMFGFYGGKLDGDFGPMSRAAREAWEAWGESVSPDPDKAIQRERWEKALVRSTRAGEVAAVVDRILKNRGRYERMAEMSGVPWHVVAAVHNMESGGNFTRHLHEGSPLSGRTRYIPKGRPQSGIPPFTWEESALDALKYDGLTSVDWSSLTEALYACEKYNGTGYLRYHRDVPSPYLWAGTSIETNGKYIEDGVWSSQARSKQIGVAAVWKMLHDRGLISLP